MPYPIQQLPANDFFKVWVIDDTYGPTVTDWTDYVADISFSFGNQVDFRRATLSPGLANIVLKNAPYDPNRAYHTLIIGSKGVSYGSAPHNIWAGHVQDITDVKTIINGELESTLTVECNDSFTYVTDGIADEEAFFPDSGETLLTQDATFHIGNSTPYGLNTQFFDYTSATTAINGGFYSPSIVEQYQMVADTILAYPLPRLRQNYSSTTHVPIATLPVIPELTINSYADATVPMIVVSDGTHTSGYPDLFYTNIEFSSSTKSVAKSVSLNNIGLKAGVYPANNTAELEALDIPYRAGATGGRELALTTCAASDNLGWNLISQTANNNKRPLWRTDGHHKLNATGLTRNNKPTVKVTQKATFTGSAAFYLNDDLSEEFALNPGGTTGNYYFRCYMATVTGRTVAFNARIEWYDDADTYLSSSNGSSVNLTASWQAVQVNAAKPSGAAYGVATLVTSNSFAVGTTVAYVSDACFGRLGSYLSFDGDYKDTTSRLYTWTGERWNSPTQLNNAAKVNTLATDWLARANNTEPVARTVSFNMSQNKELFWDIMDRFHNFDADYFGNQYTKFSVWFNAEVKNYDIVGYNVTLNNSYSEITFTLLDKG